VLLSIIKLEFIAVMLSFVLVKAYTVELEAELTQLKEENARLKEEEVMELVFLQFSFNFPYFFVITK
jgi:hypothetical protein